MKEILKNKVDKIVPVKEEKKGFCIISNNCTGGYIYRYLNKQYTSPFIWTTVSYNDFCYLIENYDNINFFNYELIVDKSYFQWGKKDCFCSKIIIDNKISLNYVHHLYSDKVKQEIKFDKNGFLTQNKVGNIEILEYIKKI